MGSVVPLALLVLVVGRLDQRPDLPGLDVGPTPMASDAELRRARAFGTPIPRSVEVARRLAHRCLCRARRRSTVSERNAHA